MKAGSFGDRTLAQHAEQMCGKGYIAYGSLTPRSLAKLRKASSIWNLHFARWSKLQPFPPAEPSRKCPSSCHVWPVAIVDSSRSPIPKVCSLIRITWTLKCQPHAKQPTKPIIWIHTVGFVPTLPKLALNPIECQCFQTTHHSNAQHIFHLDHEFGSPS